MEVTGVRPVSPDTWDDFVRLFTARGGPHHCFCTPYRIAGDAHLTSEQRRTVMAGLVQGGTPVGVLAYDGPQPVGWCSVAPREDYARLARSRTMPRVTPPATATWTVLCFFVPRPRRGTGVTRALLDGAVAYAADCGARVVEGYPFDTAGISATHRGHSTVFAAAGFTRDGPRWFRPVDPH
jgi:GNAT superfamily N-acetyltransferase